MTKGEMQLFKGAMKLLEHLTNDSNDIRHLEDICKGLQKQLPSNQGSVMHLDFGELIRLSKDNLAERFRTIIMLMKESAKLYPDTYG
tara:strand:+ start:3270 stop:3530 length:261 start_codon:yes stop_codon:yes gene_type:complete